MPKVREEFDMTSKIQPPIRFKYDIEKFVACLSFLASNIKNLDKLKAAKLLYYVDKYHLIRHGRPILGDVYYRLDYGPVPSKSLDVMNEAISPVKFRDLPQENLELLSRYIKVNEERRHPVFETKREHEFDVLSESEKEALQETVKKYGHHSGSDLIKLTHNEASWLKSEKNGEIDYRLFFDNAKDATPEAFDYLESLQEQMDLVFSLTASA